MTIPRNPHFISAGEAVTDMITTGPNQWHSKAGGAPWNVARILGSWAWPTAFLGAISQDSFGDAIYQASKQAHLDLRFLQRYPKPPLLAMVHQIQPPAYFFIGGDSADLYFDPSQLPENWQSEVQWAHFGGISLARPPLAQTLLSLAQDLKQRGVKISYDPNYRIVMDEAYDPMLEAMCQLADVIKVSDEDLYGLMRTKSPIAAMARLRAINPEAAILHTMGADGARILHRENEWRAKPPAIKVIDTIGAGDASAAGLLFSLMQAEQRGWDEHLRIAVAAGAAACLHAGATVPTLAKVQQVLQRMPFSR
ncbi:MAG: carbohydrate kinase [Burkholderiales bacterium]|nr:carbohydrate kinase [Burkholderiales bacterium]